VLQSRVQPYRTPSDNFLAFLSSLALVPIFLGSLGLQTKALGLSIDSVFLVAVLFAFTLMVFMALLVSFFADVKRVHEELVRTSVLSRLRRLRDLHTHAELDAPTNGRAIDKDASDFEKLWCDLHAKLYDRESERVRDGIEPLAHAGPFHVFLSHNWEHGQSEMRIVKERLREMLPHVSAFLDVDNLGNGKDHPHIDVSNVILCYCTRRWFTNMPCVREITRAVLRKKPLIALLEAEASETKGGHTEAECREILRGELYAARLREMREQVAQWAEAWGEPELKVPTPRQIEDALFARPPLLWSRLADLQDVTMRLIAERLLLDDDGASARAQRSSAVGAGRSEPHRRYGEPYVQEAYMMGEIARQIKASPVVLPAVRSDCRFHLYCSRHNPSAAAVAAELQAYLPALRWTDAAHELEACEHIVIHLTERTWTCGAESAAFAREVCEAMRMGVHRWLWHEVPGVRMGDGRHACSFAELIGATPEHLRSPPARLYNEIAMNLAEGEWREAGLLKMGQQLAKGSATRERWVCEPTEPGDVTTSDSVARVRASMRVVAQGGARGELSAAWQRASRAATAFLQVSQPDRLIERDDAETGRVTEGVPSRRSARDVSRRSDRLSAHDGALSQRESL